MHGGLHEDIWARVLFHLKKPSPRANSGANRHELAQNDLAMCMLVSSTFNRIAAPHLYRHVITDQAIELFGEIETPSCRPDLPSKAENLGRTRSLSLDYPEPCTSTGYLDLFRGEPWEYVSDRPHQMAGVRFANWLVLWSNMLEHVLAVSRVRTDPLQLETIAFNPYLPTHDDLWSHIRSQEPGERGRFAKTLMTAHSQLTAFCHMTNVKEVCFRSNMGPFCMLQVGSYRDTLQKNEYGPALVTLHHGDFRNTHIGSSRKNRYIYEIPHDRRWMESPDTAIQHLLDLPLFAVNVKRAYGDGQTERARKVYRRVVEQPPEMELYVSTPIAVLQMTDDHPKEARQEALRTERSVASACAQTLDSRMERCEKAAGFKLKVQWKIVEEAPKCLACGV